MNKKDLLAMPRLPATPTMLRIAKENPLKRERTKQWGFYSDRMTCRYGKYLRCKVHNGILKVALFQPDILWFGGREPLYELFIDKANDQFLTFDNKQKKWRNAKLDRLEWSMDYAYSPGRWISGADNRLIAAYLGLTSVKDGYSALLRYQLDVRERELEARHARETAAWDEEMKQIRPLPKDWSRWVDKVGIPEQFIYYNYQRGGPSLPRGALRPAHTTGGSTSRRRPAGSRAAFAGAVSITRPSAGYTAKRCPLWSKTACAEPDCRNICGTTSRSIRSITLRC